MSSNLKNLSQYTKFGIEKYSKEKNYKIGIVVSEWNQEVTGNLAEAAINTLNKYGYTSENIILKHVPGSFELPLAAQYLIEIQQVAAVICLGCVIQGDTRHFDFVCSGVTQGIMTLNLKYGIPISFGLLTTNNLQQAIDRSGGKLGNKGDEAAVAVLKMLFVKNNL